MPAPLVNSCPLSLKASLPFNNSKIVPALTRATTLQGRLGRALAARPPPRAAAAEPPGEQSSRGRRAADERGAAAALRPLKQVPQQRGQVGGAVLLVLAVVVCAGGREGSVWEGKRAGEVSRHRPKLWCASAPAPLRLLPHDLAASSPV